MIEHRDTPLAKCNFEWVLESQAKYSPVGGTYECNWNDTKLQVYGFWEEHKCIVVIKKIDLKDAGNWTCYLRGQIGTAIASTQLNLPMPLDLDPFDD